MSWNMVEHKLLVESLINNELCDIDAHVAAVAKYHRQRGGSSDKSRKGKKNKSTVIDKDSKSAAEVEQHANEIVLPSVLGRNCPSISEFHTLGLDSEVQQLLRRFRDHGDDNNNSEQQESASSQSSHDLAIAALSRLYMARREMRYRNEVIQPWIEQRIFFPPRQTKSANVEHDDDDNSSRSSDDGDDDLKSRRRQREQEVDDEEDNEEKAASSSLVRNVVEPSRWLLLAAHAPLPLLQRLFGVSAALPDYPSDVREWVVDHHLHNHQEASSSRSRVLNNAANVRIPQWFVPVSSFHVSREAVNRYVERLADSFEEDP